MLTATPYSYGNGQNLTLYKIETLGKYVKYTMFVTFFTFSPTDLDARPPNQFSRKMT